MADVKTQSVPLAVSYNYRKGSQSNDSYVLNGFLEKEADGAWANKRPGLRRLLNFATGVGYTTSAPAITDFHYQGGLEYSGYQFFVLGDRYFLISTAGNPPTLFLDEFVHPVNFEPPNTFYQGVGVQYGSHTPGVVWQGQGGLYPGYTSAAITLPWSVTMVPSLCELDNTYYVLDFFGTIHASAIGDITNWPALNSVVAFPAALSMRMVKHLWYLVAFSTTECKVYYDAAISPGAPIAQVMNAGGQIGIPAGAHLTLQAFQDVLYWIGVSTPGALGVYRMQGLEIAKISTPEVDRVLADTFEKLLTYLGYGFTALPTILPVGVVCRASGHNFYYITCPTVAGVVSGMTLCYDLTTQEWGPWTQTVAGVQAELLPVDNIGTAKGNVTFMPTANTGIVYVLEEVTYQDDGQPITFEVQTPTQNWGVPWTKIIPATHVRADNAPGTLQVSWSDDDYGTFSTPVTISTAASKKTTVRCGSTIERAWKVTHTANTPMRFYSLEVEVLPGAL